MITIVTIAYNDLPGLTRTAASLEAQTCRDFRWIVIDGGSTDGSREWLMSSPLVHSYISERDGGIYDAMQKGLQRCETDYLVFLNSGDELAGPTVLTDVLPLLSGHDVYFFSTKVKVGSRSWMRRARGIESAVYSVPAVQQSTIYRAEALRALEWPTDYLICGDFAVAAQLLVRGATALSRDITMSVFYVGGVSTTNFPRLCKEAWHIQTRYLRLPVWRRSLHLLRRWAAGCVVFLLHRAQAG